MNAFGFVLAVGGVWLIYHALQELQGSASSSAQAAPAPSGGGGGSGASPPSTAAPGGAGSVVAPPPNSNPQPPPQTNLPSGGASWLQQTAAVAQGAGIDPRVLQALVFGESGGDPTALGDVGQSIGPLQVFTGAGGPGVGVSHDCLHDVACAFSVPGVGNRITAVYNCYANGQSSAGYPCHYPGVGVDSILSNTDVFARFWADAQGACYLGGAANGCPYSNVGTSDIAGGVLAGIKRLLGIG